MAPTLSTESLVYDENSFEMILWTISSIAALEGAHTKIFRFLQLLIIDIMP